LHILLGQVKGQTIMDKLPLVREASRFVKDYWPKYCK